MKPLIFTILIFLCGIGISQTQGQSASEIKLTEQLKSLCGLTPEQLAKAEPLITGFEKKRDDIYQKYQHNPTELKKQVKQNRWDYEISLIGVLNPSQMGLVKVFDQRNPELMAHESTHYNDVSYFADNTPSDNTTNTTPSPTPANDIKNTPAPVVASNATEEATNSILTNAIKDYCSLSADQLAQAKPILSEFEKNRDSIYKLYKDDKIELGKAVRKNRLNYEVAMVDILTPQQMRVLRAFNLSNHGLMSGSSHKVNKIEFIPPGIESIADAPHSVLKPIDVTDPEELAKVSNAPVTQSESNTAIVTTKNSSPYEVNLTDQLKDLCTLTPEQIAKVDPIINDFEKKRDESYKKYQHNPTMLTKMVKQNRWNYEISLIGILNPSQMGLLKVFDQRNTELMTFNSSTVVDVSYFADNK